MKKLTKKRGKMNNINLHGKDLFGEPVKLGPSAPLADKYGFPPFTILNAREGVWQERKRAWIATGIQSELGRGDNSAPEGSPRPAMDYSKNERGDGAGKSMATAQAFTTQHQLSDGSMLSSQTGTSIFDPVLCELMYNWFCPEGGQVVDPFAGGSVRGIVAGLLGRKYYGIDLSQRQIDANKEQRDIICPDADVWWACGDSMDELQHAPQADFIFACPPYGDLEVYSDDPRDLSTMEYHTFLANYKRIILRSYKALKPNRLACFVVGDFRNKKDGTYRGFVADTINAFRDVGMRLYNDAILITAVGSLPIRVSAQFDKSRKLGKTHQNILVFLKGKKPEL